MSNITPPTTLDKLEDNLDIRFRDVFISYGRAESKAFATQLCQQLTEKGYKVWFDQNDIPLGVDFQNQIDEGIETAHNFIFIIAPHSIKSIYCRKEIDLAIKRGKRIIPILQIEPTTKEVWDMMHPAIGKINWVYMRQQWQKEQEQNDYETIDDFDAGFEGVLSLLEQEKEYVKNHTKILLRAIEWEKNHHNSMHLLVANERKQADEWLFNRFESSQPPCLPSDLHVRFISEAKKNANNLQTDVFIASAEKEKEGNNITREQIVYMLALQGYTSWTHINDLNSGVDFHKAIKKGVEGADNLIFMITKESLKSEYCIEELEYAISLNKRIIPLRLELIPEVDFPPILKEIQYIDFTDNTEAISLSKNEKTDFEKDIDELIGILKIDKEYFERHKILLNQALKWQKQDKNPSMLLRGHNLEQATIWLKIGQKREANKPLEIHDEFIKESQVKSSSERTDVFVSYSRTDGDIARKLNENLQIAGKTTWFDQESIASGADFQKEIYEGIQNADNIIFILSPESILSPYCADEVNFAQKLGKRFVTLLYREIDTTELHNSLSAVQWIDFRPNHTHFERQFAEILRTIDTDREHVQAHTKWQNKATEWNNFDKNDDLLLRGNELVLANDWIEDAKEKQKIPFITPLQEELVKESLKRENKVNLTIEKNKQLFIVAIAVIFAVAVLAGSQWYKSYESQKELAIKNLIFEAKDLIKFYPKEALKFSYEAYKASEAKNTLVIKNLYQQIETDFLINNNLSYNIDSQKIDKKTLLFTEFKIENKLRSIVSSQDNSSFIVIDEKLKLNLFDKYDGFINQLDGNMIEPDNFSQIYHEADDLEIYSPNILAISANGKRIAAQMYPPQKGSQIVLFDQNGRTLKTILDTNDGLNYSLRFEKFEEYADTTFLIVGCFKNSYSSEYKSIFIYSQEGELLDSLKENGFGRITKDGFKQKIEDKLLTNEIALKKIAKNGIINTPTFELDTNYRIEFKDKKWNLIKNKEQLLSAYNFNENTLFFKNTKNYIVAYDNDARTLSIFLYPNLLDPLLQKIEPLTAQKRIDYQIASLDDYREVPSELSDFIAKGLLFLNVFLLSILIFNYLNMLFLIQKYFKIIVYIIVGIAIGMGWFFLIMNEDYIAKVAFTSSISLSIIGFYYGKVDLKKGLYFNGLLYYFVSFLLLLGTSIIFYYTVKSTSFGETFLLLFGQINIILLLTVVISWFAIEKLSHQFSQRKFIFFSDWVGVLIFTITLFMTLAITNILEDAIGSFILVLLLPITYFLRTLIHNWVLYRYQKNPYSLLILRGYIPFGILILVLGLDILISNFFMYALSYIYIISGILLLFYTPILYLFSIFVAYKQKDKINLRANILFWWTLIALVFGFIVVILDKESLSKEKLNYYRLSIPFLFWIIPIIYWVIKNQKENKIALRELSKNGKE